MTNEKLNVKLPIVIMNDMQRPCGYVDLTDKGMRIVQALPKEFVLAPITSDAKVVAYSLQPLKITV